MSGKGGRPLLSALRTAAADIAADAFAALLVLYCLLLVGEGIKAGFVGYFFPLDIVPAAVFLAGAAAVLAAGAARRGAPGTSERGDGPHVPVRRGGEG